MHNLRLFDIAEVPLQNMPHTSPRYTAPQHHIRPDLTTLIPARLPHPSRLNPANRMLYVFLSTYIGWIWGLVSSPFIRTVCVKYLIEVNFYYIKILFTNYELQSHWKSIFKNFNKSSIPAYISPLKNVLWILKSYIYANFKETKWMFFKFYENASSMNVSTFGILYIVN